MQRFTELRVWQRSHRLTLTIYELTQGFPESERFTLVPQVRRAAISICSNIAEGAKRNSEGEYARFLNIAEGSIAETESLLRLSKDLRFGDGGTVDALIAEAEEISRMTAALRGTVEAKMARDQASRGGRGR
jgi:four helix bundle protein